MIRIELTRAILMPDFFLRTSIIHFRMVLYLVTYLVRVTVSLLCRLQAESKIHVPIYPHPILVKGEEIVRPCDQHINGTVTVRKHVTKYKNMQKWMMNFSQNLRIAALKLFEFLSPNLSIYSKLI